MIRSRPVLLAGVAWCLGVATAVGVGLLALSFVGTTVLDGPTDPLAGAADYIPAPAVSTGGDAATATPSPSLTTRQTTSNQAGAGTERLLTSPGGTVVARCTDGNAYLVLWSPAQGFQAGSVERGPATSAKVEFESPTREIQVKITCSDGVPQGVVLEEQESGH